MKNKKIRIWTYILAILPLATLVALYNRLPNQIPLHWGFNGVVEYGDKKQFWLMCALGIVVAIMLDVLPKIDPKKKNYQKFGKYYDLFAITMIVFLDLMCGIVLIESFWPNTIVVGKVVILLVGILFTVLGNLMPKIKTNFYMGIRTPWVLSNTDVWNKTQRLGGKMMFVFGILIVLLSFIVSEWVMFFVVTAGAVIVCVIPAVMSYIWYKKVEDDAKK